MDENSFETMFYYVRWLIGISLLLLASSCIYIIYTDGEFTTVAVNNTNFFKTDNLNIKDIDNGPVYTNKTVGYIEQAPIVVIHTSTILSIENVTSEINRVSFKDDVTGKLFVKLVESTDERFFTIGGSVEVSDESGLDAPSGPLGTDDNLNLSGPGGPMGLSSERV